ncbi:hypothetical protein [Nonomuraea sp. NPDC048916]|uniref:hypothetical protein n=1 Tax=Nonomuraea sp. NPDC048916 TaxID=3154232 RepID=UPI0033F3100B
MPGRPVPDASGGRDALGEPLTILDSPPVTVTAYGPSGQVLGQERNVAFGPLGRGSE